MSGDMSLNGASIHWVNGARAEGLEASRSAVTNAGVEAELQTRLGDGDISADDLGFIAGLDGNAELSAADFQRAGFDVTSAGALFRLADRANPEQVSDRTASITLGDQSREVRRQVATLLQDLSGGRTARTGNGDEGPSISRSAIERWLGTPLTDRNTAPPSGRNPGGELYQRLVGAGIPADDAASIAQAFHSGLQAHDRGTMVVGSHIEETAITARVLVSARPATAADVRQALQVGTMAEAQQQRIDRNVDQDNTFSTGESLGGPFWTDGVSFGGAIADMLASGDRDDRDTGVRLRGLVDGVRNSMQNIASTFAPAGPDGSRRFDVDGFHRALEATFPGTFDRSEAGRFLQLAANGPDNNADITFLNGFVRQIPALNDHMNTVAYSVTGVDLAPTTNTMDKRGIHSLLALDHIVTHPPDAQYEMRPTGAVSTRTVEDRGGIERDFNVTVVEGHVGKPLEFNRQASVTNRLH